MVKTGFKIALIELDIKSLLLHQMDLLGRPLKSDPTLDYGGYKFNQSDFEYNRYSTTLK